MTAPSKKKSVSKRQKTMAVLAAGLVIGLGATMTLAVWNDSEWVTGGVDLDGDGIADSPGVGTSIFEVQQNTSSPYLDSAWADKETAPGGALNFTLAALALTPGDVVFAPVSLTTTATSVGAESIALAGAVPSPAITAVDDDDLLFAALQLRVVVAVSADAATPAACNAAAFAAGSNYVVGSQTAAAALAAGGPALPTITDLAGAGADKLDYCFEISLPAGASSDLQGRTLAPSWQFIADSVS